MTWSPSDVLDALHKPEESSSRSSMPWDLNHSMAPDTEVGGRSTTTDGAVVWHSSCATPTAPAAMAAGVRAAEGSNVPVTVKFRIGIDDSHHTHLDAGRIAADEGAAAVALHARTAAQRYSGTADWDQIAALKAHVTSVPVLGNGDIFDADDALAMMATTGCDGVVIGRGCLGRPWMFAELSDAFAGRDSVKPPTLGEVATIIRRHGALLSAHFGEDKGMRDIRKHVAWYLHGFPAGAELRRALALVKTLDELEELLANLDSEVPFPQGATGPRGRQGSPASVALPEGWLTDPDDCTVPTGADVMHSGG